MSRRTSIDAGLDFAEWTVHGRQNPEIPWMGFTVGALAGGLVAQDDIGLAVVLAIAGGGVGMLVGAGVGSVLRSVTRIRLTRGEIGVSRWPLRTTSVPFDDVREVGRDGASIRITHAAGVLSIPTGSHEPAEIDTVVELILTAMQRSSRHESSYR